MAQGKKEIMKSFIHTFCIKTKIDNDEYRKINAVYQIEYYSNMHKHLLNTYKDRGLRIEIFQCKEIEVRMDKDNCWNKLNLIFTTYKLLHNGNRIGEVTEKHEIEEASKKVIMLLVDIYKKSGVDLLKRASINRVDVTKDIITPSDAYTKEIIRIAKETELPYGYKMWIPEENDKLIHPQWKVENAVFVNNHSQELEFKLYDKKADLEINKECTDFLENKSWLRIELTMKKKMLKKQGYVKSDIITVEIVKDMLQAITVDADYLLINYIGGILSPVDNLSKKILTKYIKYECGSKVRRAEKMIKYIECMKNGKIDSYGSVKAVSNIETEFEILGISPIYSKVECPYIPSVEKLIGGQEINYRLLNIAKHYNERRGRYDLIYWR